MEKKFKYAKFFLIILIIIIFVEVGMLVSNPAPYSESSSSFKSHADAIIKKCSSTDYRPSCYDLEIPKLMNSISMENAFEVAEVIQSQDFSYRYCHILGHYLSAIEYNKNPDNWREIIHKCPYGVCANGCQHGVLQERFRSEFLTDGQTEELKMDLADVCEEQRNWHPTPFEQAHCYHGLGHSVLIFTDADIPKSLEICDNISVKNDGRNFKSLCYGGMFMQIFQPLEPEDTALIKDKAPAKENVEEFCSNLPGGDLRKEACWLQAWPYFREEVKTQAGAIDFCSEMEEFIRKENCYVQIFHIAAQSSNYEIPTLKEFCGGFQDNDLKIKCFINSASAIVDGGVVFIDRAVDLCASSKEFGVDDECYLGMAKFAAYKFNLGTENFAKLCAALPEPWNERCVNRSA